MRFRLIWLATLVALLLAACSRPSVAPQETALFSDQDLATAIRGTAEAVDAAAIDSAGSVLASAAATASHGASATTTLPSAALQTQAGSMSNTGGYLAYVESKGRSWAVRVLGLGNTGTAGSNGDRLVYKGKRPIQSVAVSNDGTFVAFVAKGADDDDVYLLDLTTGTVEVFALQGDDRDVSMSADGRVVVWARDTANGPSILWLSLDLGGFIEVDASLFEWLFGLPIFGVEPSVSADGTAIAFVDPTGIVPPMYGYPPLKMIDLLHVVPTGTGLSVGLDLLILGDALATPSVDYGGARVLFNDVYQTVPYLTVYDVEAGAFQDVLAGVAVEHPYLTADGDFATFGFGGASYLATVDGDFELLPKAASATNSATYWAKGSFTRYAASNDEGTFVRPDDGSGIDDSGRTVGYHAFAFTSPRTDFYEIASVQDYDGYLTLYQGSFDPNDPEANVIANNDDFGGGFDGTTGRSLIVAELKKNVTYVVVTSACGADGTPCGPNQGSFVNVIRDGGEPPPPPQPPTELPEPDNTRFNITVRFWNESFTPDETAVFTMATDRWSEVIVADLENIPNFELTEAQTTEGAPGIVGELDDLVIDAAKVAIDGPGGVLARAGAYYVRNGGPDDFTPIYGIMEFDEAEFGPGQFYEDIDAFAAVILHEMGHVLGISRSFWGPLGYLQGNRSAAEGCSEVSKGDDPRYVGPAAVDAWVNFYAADSATVPVANTGGCGTADSHWREIYLDDELMTGYAEGGGEPLSRVTIGALEDLGYGVDYSAADAWSIPALPRLLQVSPVPTEYQIEYDFGVSFTGAALGEVTASVTPVDLSLLDPTASTSGCEAADFAGFPAGNIALLQRGTCAFGIKAANAAAAGATAVLIANQGDTPDRTGVYSGTFGADIAIIGVPISFQLAVDLANTPGLVMTVDTDPSDGGALRIQRLAGLDWHLVEDYVPLRGAIDREGNVTSFGN